MNMDFFVWGLCYEWFGFLDLIVLIVVVEKEVYEREGFVFDVG